VQIRAHIGASGTLVGGVAPSQGLVISSSMLSPPP
jgi:hypothetical protein